MHILELPDFDTHAVKVLADHLFNLCIDSFAQAKKENRPPRDDTELSLLLGKDRTNIHRGKSYKYETALKLAIALRVETQDLFPDKTRWLFSVARNQLKTMPEKDVAELVFGIINGKQT